MGIRTQQPTLSNLCRKREFMDWKYIAVTTVTVGTSDIGVASSR